MAKAPQPGRSKTRLAAAIGVAAASELSACFLRDVAAAIEAVPEALGRCGYGVYAPAGAEHIMRQVLPAEFEPVRLVARVKAADRQFARVGQVESAEQRVGCRRSG